MGKGINMENYTNAFLDVISNINNLGKERGFKNGFYNR